MRKILATALGVALALTATVALAGRNSSGTMSFTSVAGGYPYVSGQTISSSGVNANFAEIVTEIGDSLSRSGKGGMTAPLRCADGSAALPAFSWTQDTNTGLYRIGADNIGISLGGTKKVDLASGLTAFTDPVSFAGSTMTTGVARYAGAAYFDAAASFVSSVTVPTPLATTDATNKAYVDALVAAVTTTMTAGSGWSFGGTSVNSVTKRGGVVTVTFAETVADSGASDWLNQATVPAGFRPASTVYFRATCVDAATANYTCEAYITTDGVLGTPFYDNGTSMVAIFAIGAGDGARGTVTYVTN